MENFIFCAVSILDVWKGSAYDSALIHSTTSAGRNIIYHLSANAIKWFNTLKQFRRQQTTNCLSVFDYFVGFTLKGLNWQNQRMINDKLTNWILNDTC